MTGENGILTRATDAKEQTEIGEEKEQISLGYNDWKIAKTQDENANLKVESATSITVEDINAITGYDPTTAQYGKGGFNEYGNEVTYTRGEGTALSSSGTNGQTYSGTRSTFNYYDKATKTFVPLTTGSTKITSTSYWYNPTTLNASQSEPSQGVDTNGVYNDIYQMLFGKWTVTENNGSYSRNFTGSGSWPSYWLASACADACNNSVAWGLRVVGNGVVNSDYRSSLYYSNGSSYNFSYGVRPVVSLKSEVSLEWNETAKEWKIK